MQSRFVDACLGSSHSESFDYAGVPNGRRKFGVAVKRALSKSGNDASIMLKWRHANDDGET